MLLFSYISYAAAFVRNLHALAYEFETGSYKLRKGKKEQIRTNNNLTTGEKKGLRMLCNRNLAFHSQRSAAAVRKFHAYERSAQLNFRMLGTSDLSYA